jgi:Flp pilus assembly protein TadG
MLHSAQSILRKLPGLRRLAAETRGAEIAEAAAVLPLMFMMLLGIFWFGQAFSIYGAITRAAEEGARAGAFPYYATCTSANCSNLLSTYETNAVTATNNALLASNLNPLLAQPPAVHPAFNGCSGAATTCNTSASTNICVQAPVVLTKAGSTGAGVCGISVSFQYPFQFWLPFTSLNNQQIWLAAQARVRMETH